MKKVSESTFWQTTFVFTFIVNLTILIWSISRWTELKVVMWRSIWVFPLFFYLATLAGCVLLFIWIQRGNAGRLLTLLEKFPPAAPANLAGTLYRLAAGLAFIGLLLLIPALKFSFHAGEVVKKATQDPVLTTILFYWGAWWLVLAAAATLKVAFKTSWAGGFASALVLLGTAYEFFIRFQLVTTYPFSLGWSEASRFYYGSLYFAQSIYGLQVPLSALHPSRYLLQALPFLIPGLGLTASRLWQYLLWMGLTAISAVALTWRALGTETTPAMLKQTWVKALFAGWLFLFLLRVGVYYHLEVMVFVPLLFVQRKQPWRSLIAILFASAWAGISRVNWFPVPAMFAIALYLLEEPLSAAKNLWNYLVTPLLWGLLGLLTALAAQAAYIPLSGNAQNARVFTSSFTSPELWYRLWPNDSYPLGIIPAVLVVCGALLVTLALASLTGRKSLHPLRWAGLWGMLVILAAGGLIVSVKIGGGGDLHNMDAFAVMLALITYYFIGGRVRAEIEPTPADRPAPLSWPVAATALLIPLMLLIPALSPTEIYHQDANQQAFVQLKGLAEGASQKGPVLFINERHLLTFHQINVPLVPDYEAVTLMEMAMSNNQPYLQQFYSDLKNHRFAAIVTGKQNIGIKEEGAFSDENNIWNSRISPYILCYYEPLPVQAGSETLTYIEADQSRIEFYLPRATPGVCP